jgi:hypothetical protein
LCINVMGCSDAESTKETEAPVQAQETWELPEGMIVEVVPFLAISPTGSHIGFRAWNPKSNWPRPRFAILDTRSGRVDRVSSLRKTVGIKIPDIIGAMIQFSKSGEYLLITSNDGSSVRKINLATGRVTGILDTPFPSTSRGWWFGDNVAVSTRDNSREGKTHPVRIVSSEGMAIRTLPVYGEVLAADRNGRFLVVLADPNHLTKPMARETLRETAHILVVSDKGKKLKDMGREPIRGYPTRALISSSGAYVAFFLACSPEEIDEGKTITKVVSMLDGSQRSVLGRMPIVVTDRGELLIFEGKDATSEDKNASGLAVFVFKILSVDGKEKVLFGGDPNVLSATIANGRLYYLSQLANGKRGISWMEFR